MPYPNVVDTVIFQMSTRLVCEDILLFTVCLDTVVCIGLVVFVSIDPILVVVLDGFRVCIDISDTHFRSLRRDITIRAV